MLVVVVVQKDAITKFAELRKSTTCVQETWKLYSELKKIYENFVTKYKFFLVKALQSQIQE